MIFLHTLASALKACPFFKILLIVVILDTILGASRAIKEHKFNSCVGIDGAVRKVSMLACVFALAAVDIIIGINMIDFIPKEYTGIFSGSKIGISELFCILFILYEAVSILKNMTLCGLPVPTKIKIWIQKFLDDMTEELPEETVEELHKELTEKKNIVYPEEDDALELPQTERSDES